MSTTLDPARVIGHKVLDAEGHKIGQADEVYLDDSTGTPQWVTVKGGLFGGKGHFAPLGGAVLVDNDVRLAYAKSQVDSAPELETGRHLSVEEEMTLYRHYGLGQPEAAGKGMNGTAGAAGTATGTATGTADGRTAGGTDTMANGMTTSGMSGGMAGGMTAPTGMDRLGTTDAHPEAVQDQLAMGARDGRVMTRYEERLHIGTERVEAGRARLHKTVTSEKVERTVPLMHQEIRVEREPIPDGEHGASMGDADFAESELDVTLYEERPVVSKEAVAVERVRVRVEDVTEQVVVHEEVRMERIDLVDDPSADAKARRDM
ncbi:MULTISPECIES: PRC and DUF2382 domain-containing protein [Streptacidiphilus]|uniref:DUF2382 domain-containing protein n=1 Tax=Streptacidiphilus cavernicola TaxID=3342716 RepID=A0ABV6UJC3_9ACTN|nr:PRC and DUF2382 domain-containing protein [Streptacidiphilus jeojiense]